MVSAAQGSSTRRVAGRVFRFPPATVRLDAVVAALIFAGLLAIDESSVVTHVATFAHAVRIAGLVGACTAIPCRRRYPRSALAVATLGAVLASGLGGPPQAAVCAAITGYTAATTITNRWRSPPVVIGVCVAAGVAIGQIPTWVPASIAAAAVVCVGWFIGQATRERRSRLAAAAEQRAEQDRQRAADLRQASMDERLVIARELHDVVAHAMSVIAVRAGVARMVMDHDSAEVKEALGIIETTTRRALQEMRLLVGVLRRDGDLDPQLVPAPGLADLNTLIEQIRRAGIDVTLHIRGTPRPLPAGVDLSAYRIAQEALTNVVRHAGTTTAALTLHYHPDELTVEVTDTGPAPTRTPTRRRHRTDPGHGLIGMAERAALFGGHLDAAPADRGFRVHAILRTDQGTP